MTMKPCPMMTRLVQDARGREMVTKPEIVIVTTLALALMLASGVYLMFAPSADKTVNPVRKKQPVATSMKQKPQPAGFSMPQPGMR